MLWIIGDIHGYLGMYKGRLNLIRHKDPEAVTVQVGDMGLGFGDNKIPECGPNDYFIHGNHDDHYACVDVPGYLGRFGVKEINGQSVFFLSGAMSTDRQYRTEGKNWWEHEELSYTELNEAISLYQEVKPDVVVTHDCPMQVREILYQRGHGRTVPALTQMFESHQPKFWAYGHHHQTYLTKVKGTCFACVGEADGVPLNDDSYEKAHDLGSLSKK